LGLNGIIIAIFEMILVKHLEKKKKDTFFIALGIVFAAFSFSFLLVPFASVWSAILMIIFFTMGEMLSLPFVNTFIVGRANEENRGRYASAFSLSWATAQIIGPAGGAFIADKINYHFLWTLLIVLCLISSLGIRFILGKK
jgi:MFS family permease